MDKRLLLLLNPASGMRRANRLMPEIIRLYNDRNYECAVYITSGSGDATRFMRANAARYDRVVCIGGDGTLNETIAGIIEAGVRCPVGYIPAGTTNDYAASLGLSSDILTAAADAVDGVGCYFDMGSFNGRNFIYTASCGAFARTSYTTSQLAKNVLGHAAYVIEGIKDLPSLKPIHMRLECEDRVLEDDYIFCAVTNSISVGGILKLNPDMVRLNDGLFEVLLIKYPTMPSHLPQILRALYSGELNCDMIDSFTVDRLCVKTISDVEWTLDGERGEAGREFEIINQYKKIQLVLPENAAKTAPVVSDTVPAPLEDANAAIEKNEIENELSN